MQFLTAQPLDRLLANLPLHISGNADIPISSIAADSRLVLPGALFFCLRGERADGHDFAAAAAASGAVAVVAAHELTLPAGIPLIVTEDPLSVLSPIAARLYGSPSKQLTCVGVTGTNGKTTVTYFLESIATAAGKRFGLIGTLGARLGSEPIEALANTTPFAHDTQRLLARFRDAGAQGAILEVSSHALALHRVDDVAFDVAVLTNVTQDHLDFHKTFDEYRSAKRKLFGASAGKNNASPVAVLNVDDEEGRTLAATLPKRLTFGLENAAALFNATEVNLRSDGSTFLVRSLRPAPLAIRLPGAFNVQNALAAAAAASALDFDVEAIAQGLEAVREVPGRMIAVPAGGIGVYIDYAHTPDGMEKILRATRTITRGRVLCVFGCGGDRDASKRPRMGRIAQELADYVILTTDNPRHENPKTIVDDILAGMDDGGAQHEVIMDRAAAIGHAIDLARPGDAVLVAGKGHESYQIVGDVRLPFSDVAVAQAAVEKVSR